MPPKQPWSLLILIASGIFFGSFWLIFGFLSVLGSVQTWWHYPAALGPGSAILYLVIMARRAPLPYGAGLISLGFLPFLFGFLRGIPLVTMLLMGGPVVLIGILFVIWRERFKSTKF